MRHWYEVYTLCTQKWIIVLFGSAGEEKDNLTSFKTNFKKASVRNMLIWATHGQTCWGQYTDFIWAMASHIKPTCNKCRYFIFFFHVEYCYVLAEFCVCVPLIPKYDCGLYSTSQYQHDYIIISLIPKITLLFYSV